MINPFTRDSRAQDRIADASNCAQGECTTVPGSNGRKYKIRKVCHDFEINCLIPIPSSADASRVLLHLGRVDSVFPSYWEVWERPDGSAILAIDIRKDVELIRRHLPDARLNAGLSIITDWAEEKPETEATAQGGK